MQQVRNRTIKISKHKNKKNIAKLGKRSFSPSINRVLSIKNKKLFKRSNKKTKKIKKIFDKRCKNNEIYFKNKQLCKNYKSRESQKLMLKNLEASMIVRNPNIIVAPKQYQSNCWFNTMFMTLFVSDKGRKFFKYFRDLMITGKRVTDKNKIVNVPSKLHNTLFLLNKMIDMTLQGSLGNNDTNDVIRGIFNNIPSSNHGMLVKTGQASNPLDFYFSLMNYLNDKRIRIELLTIDTDYTQSNIISIINLFIENKKSISTKYKLPHIIVLEYFDSSSKNKTDTPQNFSLIENNKKITYKLDSSVVRNTERHHFCSTLTINGKEFGFDGISYHRLNRFNWKKVINLNKNWTFKGSTNTGKDKILWNFRNSYQLLFYYRI